MKSVPKAHTLQLCQKPCLETRVYWRHISDYFSDILAPLIGPPPPGNCPTVPPLNPARMKRCHSWRESGCVGAVGGAWGWRAYLSQSQLSGNAGIGEAMARKRAEAEKKEEAEEEVNKF